jgi:pSer/pThr/pTyr-binding forkhead associated (FHA) protein
MDVRLLVAHSKADAKQIRLGAETLIGRSPDCNLRIASGQVSRRHCLVKVAETLVSVRDLGSANGTRLNGQTISTETDVPIPPGSTLVVGPLKFVVQFAPPNVNEDGGSLPPGAQHDSSEILELAAVPVVNGEDTKDYPSSQKLLDLLRRKKKLKPGRSAAADVPPADDAYDALQEFLKDP